MVIQLGNHFSWNRGAKVAGTARLSNPAKQGPEGITGARADELDFSILTQNQRSKPANFTRMGAENEHGSLAVPG
jgi:hypothetical protein